MNVSAFVKELKKERDRVEKQLSGLNAALSAFAGVYRGAGKVGRSTGRRSLSAAARKKIAAAQRARWARWRDNKKKA